MEKLIKKFYFCIISLNKKISLYFFRNFTVASKCFVDTLFESSCTNVHCVSALRFFAHFESAASFEKRRLLFLVVFFIQSQTYANSEISVISLKEGPYWGANFGMASLMDSQSIPNLGYRHLFSHPGFVGGGLAGYDKPIFKKLNLGIEGFMQGDSLALSTTRNYEGVHRYYRARLYYNAGIRLLPGLKLDEKTIIHGIIGYSSALISTKDSNNYGVLEKNRNKDGFQCGLGLETKMRKKLSIRADMFYTLYSPSRSLGVSLPLSSTPQYYFKKFETLEGSVSLVYRFT